MNVHCVILNGKLEVYRGNDLVATVEDTMSGNPLITTFGNIHGLQTLTFDDLDIINDNWNQMQEMSAQNN